MKKSLYNIFFGILGQIITICIGLLLPRLRIVSFGSEVNGMLSSVQQIYAYLALLEAGVGSATLQALYGPVAKGNKEDINSILSATHTYYKKTGVIYFFAIIVFAIVYPLTIVTDIPKLTIVAVILLNGAGNVLAYFFQGKYRILLQAEGKQYIITNLATIVSVFSGIVKVILLNMGCSVLSLQLAYLIFNIFQVVYFAWYIKKHYTWIDLKIPGNYEAISQKNSVLIHQISQMIFNNTDVLLITVFCGLKAVSVYSLYNLIFDMVATLIGNINNGFSYKLGQLFNSDKKQFDRYYTLYERYYTSLSFALYCITYLFITHFIRLYMKGVNDANYLDSLLPVLFVMIKLMVSGRAPSGFVATYAGHFKKTQNRAVWEAVTNLVASLIFVKCWGIYGVLIGTIVSLLYRANDMIIYANRRILFRKSWETYKWWLLNIVIFITVSVVFHVIPMGEIKSYISFFVVLVISSLVIVGVFIGGTFFVSYKITKPYLIKIVDKFLDK